MQAIRQGLAAGQTNQWLHLELERREMLMLTDARGQTLECRSGELWLTEAGGGDTVLRAGERHVVQEDGYLVISACRDSRFALGGLGRGPGHPFLAAGAGLSRQPAAPRAVRPGRPRPGLRPGINRPCRRSHSATRPCRRVFPWIALPLRPQPSSP